MSRIIFRLSVFLSLGGFLAYITGRKRSKFEVEERRIRKSRTGNKEVEKRRQKKSKICKYLDKRQNRIFVKMVWK